MGLGLPPPPTCRTALACLSLSSPMLGIFDLFNLCQIELLLAIFLKTCIYLLPEWFHNPFPGLEDTGTMAASSVSSEIVERGRKKLLEILQQDPDSVLDTLTSRGLISEEEYETLENVTDPLKKSRKLLILVQKRGEVSCQQFLKCLLSTFPESATICGLQHGKLDFCTFVGGVGGVRVTKQIS